MVTAVARAKAHIMMEKTFAASLAEADQAGEDVRLIVRRAAIPWIGG